MSILVICDVDIKSKYSSERLGFVRDGIRELFLDSGFIRNFSECLISTYCVFEDETNEVCVNLRLRGPQWHPVGSCSCIEQLQAFDKLREYVSNNCVMIKVDSIDKDRQYSSIGPKLKSVSEWLGDILKETIILGESSLERDISSSQSNSLDLLDWKYEGQIVGRERQLLVLWLMDNSKLSSRVLSGGLPNVEDIKESFIMPNVEIKYFTLNEFNSFFDIDEPLSQETRAEIIPFPPLNMNGNILKDSILNAINSFFFLEKYTVIFSENTSSSNFNYFNDLSVLEFRLFPSLRKFPIITKENIEVLSFPLLSHLVGVISTERFQPLPILTRRLINLCNSSAGKSQAIQALILAIKEEKFALALELNSDWFALLAPVTIGNRTHLALDILPPGYLIASHD